MIQFVAVVPRQPLLYPLGVGLNRPACLESMGHGIGGVFACEVGEPEVGVGI